MVARSESVEQVDVVGTTRRDAAPLPPPPHPSGTGPGSKGDTVVNIDAKSRHGVQSNPSKSAPPLPDLTNPWRKETTWNPSGCIVYSLFLAAYAFYFYCRISFTLGGGLLWYAHERSFHLPVILSSGACGSQM